MHNSHIKLSACYVNLIHRVSVHDGFGCEQWIFLVYEFKHKSEVELLYNVDSMEELGQVGTVDRILVCEESLVRF